MGCDTTGVSCTRSPVGCVKEAWKQSRTEFRSNSSSHTLGSGTGGEMERVGVGGGPACSCERAHQHLLLKGLLPVCSLQVMASFTSFFFTHWIPRFGKLGGERGSELGLAQANHGKTSSAAASTPVDPPLLQLGLVVSVFTVFPNQLVGVGLVGGVLGYQGDADTQRTTVVVHLRRRHVLLKRPLC